MQRLTALLATVALTACATTAAEPTSTPVDTATPEPTVTPTAIPDPTATATTAPTETPVPSPTPIPDRITDPSGAEMILIPAGTFLQGSEPGVFVDNVGAQFEIPPDELPQREVMVDAFYIDRLEVSNAQYLACVEAGACEPPFRTDCCTEQPGAYIAWPEYFGNPEFDDYPVIFISWYDAQDYCTWRGARLPTEAEWEKASRGTDGRIYPWGNELPTPEVLNFQWPIGTFPERPLYTTSPVESYEAGASPYGVLNLAGNVYEWVYDIYDQDYYSYGPTDNPTGPEDGGAFRVTRGGSFWNQAYRNRSANRNNAFLPAD
ncbi:MAG: formylglycine-generating enzyme family protein [Anaerolineae bacterium]